MEAVEAAACGSQCKAAHSRAGWYPVSVVARVPLWNGSGQEIQLGAHPSARSGSEPADGGSLPLPSAFQSNAFVPGIFGFQGQAFPGFSYCGTVWGPVLWCERVEAPGSTVAA